MKELRGSSVPLYVLRNVEGGWLLFLPMIPALWLVPWEQNSESPVNAHQARGQDNRVSERKLKLELQQL